MLLLFVNLGEEQWCHFGVEDAIHKLLFKPKNSPAIFDKLSKNFADIT